MINLEFYPATQPTYTLQSVYHEANGKPVERALNNYPYSPRWSSAEHAERAREYFKEVIPKLKAQL